MQVIGLSSLHLQEGGNNSDKNRLLLPKDSFCQQKLPLSGVH
jgi:hypothetical protein